MFQTVQQRRKISDAVAVDIAPLIDIVFILLIFFLVTTTFVRDAGVTVTRPQAAQSSALDPIAMRISITAAGSLFTDGRQIELGEVRHMVRQFVAREPSGAIVVVPDEAVPSGRLLQVIDEAKAAGAQDVALATRPREGR